MELVTQRAEGEKDRELIKKKEERYGSIRDKSPEIGEARIA